MNTGCPIDNVRLQEETSEAKPLNTPVRHAVLGGVIRTGWGLLNQQSFSSLDYAHKKKQTKCDRFLAKMDAVVPWDRLTALYYPRRPTGGAEEAFYDNHAMRTFARTDLSDHTRIIWK